MAEWTLFYAFTQTKKYFLYSVSEAHVIKIRQFSSPAATQCKVTGETQRPSVHVFRIKTSLFSFLFFYETQERI